MNPQEINKRIAIACGYEKIYHVDDKVLFSNGREVVREEALPNYYEDLNAMYDAESYIMDESSIEYEKWLRKFSCVWHVKASKKAEAFLRAINQWEESK